MHRHRIEVEDRQPFPWDLIAVGAVIVMSAFIAWRGW